MDKICPEDGCNLPIRSRGYCRKHYDNFVRWGLIKKLPPRVVQVCTVPDCNENRKYKNMCKRHYVRWKTTGDPGPAEKLRKNDTWTAWRVNPDGYIERTKSNKNKRSHQSQHRFVMEEYLGRSLVKGENVHHKNGDRQDNRIENLELWNIRQPKGQRAEDKVEWALEILKLYGPDYLVKEQD